MLVLGIIAVSIAWEVVMFMEHAVYSALSK